MPAPSQLRAEALGKGGDRGPGSPAPYTAVVVTDANPRWSAGPPLDDLLLERDAELGLICTRIAALRGAATAGSCVLLSAEAGGGKTSLLAEVARRAGRDVEWLWGASEPMLSSPPTLPGMAGPRRLPGSAA